MFGVKVSGLEFRYQGLGFRVWGLGLKVSVVVGSVKESRSSPYSQPPET